ncbi:MAG: IgGFc-binding protein [Polyangiaceae bacterium]|nr:IgGFc-binding protein [Polyangiaceae bacterium]
MRRELWGACIFGLVGAVLATSACSSAGSSGGGTAAAGNAGGSGGGGGINVGGNGGINVGGGGAGGGSGGGFVGDPKTCAEAALAKTYIGCDFWPTVVANNVWTVFDFAVVVANAGDQPADVKIERNGAQVGGGQVPPNGLEKFYLPWVPELKGPQVDNCGSAQALTATVRAPGGAYHLTSSVPVTAYQFNALEYKGQGGPPGKNWSSCPGNTVCPSYGKPVGCFSFSNDASLLLPTTALTGNYRITGQKGWPAIGLNMGPYMAVTGTTDNTEVSVLTGLSATIVAGGGITQTGPGQVAKFNVNRGEVVQLLGTANGDLSGSLIQSNHPVQVIHGIPCIQSPIGTPACDHIEECVFPAETLGKHYFVVPPTGPLGNVPGHVVRIYGNVDNTQLTYPSGGQPPSAPSTVGAGQVVDLGIVKQPFEVTGSSEFAVGMFQLGAQLVDPTPGEQQKGDPAQSLATAVEQFRTKYVFLAPDDYDVSYVDIVMPDSAQVILDGSAAAGAPTPLGSGHSVLRAKLSAGVGGAHLLTSDKPVGLQVVGYGSYTSYQYPGGLNLTLIAPPPPPIK